MYAVCRFRIAAGLWVTKQPLMMMPMQRAQALPVSFLHRRWCSCWSTSTTLLRHWQEELELRRQLLFAVKAVGEVDSANAAVGVQLHTERLNVVRTIGTPREVGEIELNLV